ncbi:MAG: hypothetical protein ACTH31_05955, partial [Pseudoclavibacter sp.]
MAAETNDPDARDRGDARDHDQGDSVPRGRHAAASAAPQSADAGAATTPAATTPAATTAAVADDETLLGERRGRVAADRHRRRRRLRGLRIAVAVVVVAAVGVGVV